MVVKSSQKTARVVGLTVLAVIALAAVVFLVISLLQGDPTNDLEERQPDPASMSPTAS